MKIYLERSALVTILAEGQASVDGKETGGILAGFEADDALIVTIAGPPGPNAVRRANLFDRDIELAEAILQEAFEGAGAVWIGDWHTHTLVSGRPSPTDYASYQRIISEPELKFEVFLSLIVTSDSGTFTDARITPWLARPGSIEKSQIALP